MSNLYSASQQRTSPVLQFPDHTIGIDDDPDISGLESPLLAPVSANMLVGKGMTLKEQEQVVDSLRKENYNLRMKIYFLEERLHHVAPAHMNETLRDNVELRFQLNHMQSKVTQLEDELAASQPYSPHAINRFGERENALQNQIQSLTQTCESLDLQLLETRQSKLSIADELNYVKDDLARARSALDLVNTESTTLRTELEFSKNQVQGLRSQLIDASLASRQGDRSPSNRRGLRNEYDTNPQDLETQLGHLQAQITAQNMIITGREKELNKAHSDISTLTAKLESVDQDRAKAQPKGYDMVDTDAAQIQITELRRKLSAKTKEVNALQSELDFKNNAQEEAVSNIVESRARDQNALKRQVTELKWQLSRCESELQVAQQTVQEKEQARNMAETLAGHVGRQSVKDLAARDEEFANAGSEIDRLNKLVKTKIRDINDLQKEVAEHVKTGTEMREEISRLRTRMGSQLSASKATSSAVLEMDAEVNQVKRDLMDVEAKWRAEVSARCAIEERELSRVAELDKKLRSVTHKCANLEHNLKVAEDEIRTLAQQRETENQIAAESSKRQAYQTDQGSELQNMRRQVSTLEKSVADARSQARKLVQDMKTKDSEITKLRDQLTTWQAEADVHHSKLSQMVVDAQNDAAMTKARYAAGADQPRSNSGSDEETMVKYQQLLVDHASIKSQLTQAQSEIKHLTLNQASSNNSMLYKSFSRVLSSMGKSIDSINTYTPWTILEDHLLREVGDLMQIKSYFNTRMRSLEEHWTSEFQLLMGKFDRKIQQMNRVEQAIRVVTQQVKHMKTVFVHTKQVAQVAKEQQQVALAELSDLKRASTSSSTASSVFADYPDLKERIYQLESNLRLERQGAKRSVEQSYKSIRDLERQLEAARKMNVEYQGLLQHQRSKLEMALNSPSDRRFHRLKEELREIRNHEGTMARVTARPPSATHTESPSLMSEALENMRISGEDAG